MWRPACKWLFLQAGDIVKGGKQDRTIMTDLTLAPRSGPQPIEAFCVEHGRWTPSGDGLAFLNNPGIVAGAPLRIAIQGEKSQPRVWQEVARSEQQAVKAARAGGETVGKSMQRSTRETDEAVVYQYGHLSQPASKQAGSVVVHQNYRKK